VEHVSPGVTVARHDDLPELADVAAATFPLACPPSSTADNIALFIADNLSAERFADYLADPNRVVFVAREAGRIRGYAMLIRGVPDDPDVARAVAERPAVELSKIYVLPDAHGGAVSAALMAAGVDHAVAVDARTLWLGVNQQNRRAQRFYVKHGFAVAGTKTFPLGGTMENDFVMVRRL
jgi:ribosomal protein S18 acetylase RimI-like enzyme